MITRYKQIDPNYTSPIKACLFLAVPHRGTGNANVFGDFLRAISKVSLPGLRPNTSNLKDLERKNKKLADITDRFIQILNANTIQIISCYEDRPYAAAKGQVCFGKVLQEPNSNPLADRKQGFSYIRIRWKDEIPHWD